MNTTAGGTWAQYDHLTMSLKFKVLKFAKAAASAPTGSSRQPNQTL